TRAVPVCADPFVPAAVSTAMSSNSLLIQSKRGGKSIESAASVPLSANRLQLSTGHGTSCVVQRVRLLQKLTELQRIDGLTIRDQLANHCRIAPAVAVDVGPLQPGAPGRRRFEPPGAVHEEHLLAADDRSVEIDDGIAPPHRS